MRDVLHSLDYQRREFPPEDARVRHILLTAQTLMEQMVSRIETLEAQLDRQARDWEARWSRRWEP